MVSSLASSLATSLTQGIVYHTFTFSATHGSVVAAVDGVVVTSPASIRHGKSVVCTITPDEGYEYTGTSPATILIDEDVTVTFHCTPIE